MAGQETVHEGPARIAVERDGESVGYVVLAHETLRIGRGPASDLVLPDQHVSSNHAEIQVRENGTALIDVGSLNGTWVDGERLPKGQLYFLHDGERFRIGPFTLVFTAAHVHSQPSAAPTEIPPSPPPPAAPRRVPPREAPPVKPAVQTVWPVGPLSRYLSYLPDVFQAWDGVEPTVDGAEGSLDGDESPDSPDAKGFLGRYLRIFEAIWEPLEQRQDWIGAYFDPRSCPESFLPWLASWFGLRVPAELRSVDRVRDLVSHAVDLHRKRGTREGLARLIQICTGVEPTIVETATPWVVHIRLAADGSVDRRFVEALIEEQKPAHVGYILELV